MKPLDDAALGRITRAVLALDHEVGGQPEMNTVGRVLQHLGNECLCDFCDRATDRDAVAIALAELDQIRSEHWWMEPEHSPSGKHVKALARLEAAIADVRRVLEEARR